MSVIAPTARPPATSMLEPHCIRQDQRLMNNTDRMLSVTCHLMSHVFVCLQSARRSAREKCTSAKRMSRTDQPSNREMVRWRVRPVCLNSFDFV